MPLLFINACMRKNSRTERLARAWLGRYEGEVVEVRLASTEVLPLDPQRLQRYSSAVKRASYDDELFSLAHQFASATDLLIAAPFWNYGLPAALHGYLELVCSQGVTFDTDETGAYVSLVRAKSLTFVTTAGGAKPEDADDHAFGYVRTLATQFWHIPEIRCIAAWGLDAPNARVEELLEQTLR